MPQLQAIDLSPREGPPTALEKTLSGFARRNRENQLRQQDTDALREIYQGFQNRDEDIQNAYLKLQTNPDLSPSERVNQTRNLLELKKNNVQQQKAAEKQNKDLIKQQIKQQQDQERRENFKKAGANEKQLALFDAATEGGKTEVIANLLEQQSRNLPPVGLKEGLEDFDAGTTPSQRFERQENRYKLQSPQLIKDNDSLLAHKKEAAAIGFLQNLDSDPNFGQGWSRLNYNPFTGALLFPAAASAEEQAFVKTINDFTTRAKESYGARVTNFELDRFLQRLPTLANSKEGRKLILRQMALANEIDVLEKESLQEVFDEYGVRNIDYPTALRKAREKIQDKVQTNRDQMMKLNDTSSTIYKDKIENARKKLKPGKVLMRDRAGRLIAIPKENVEAARGKLEEV